MSSAGLTWRAMQQDAPGGSQAQALEGLSMLQGPLHGLPQLGLHLLQPPNAIPGHCRPSAFLQKCLGVLFCCNVWSLAGVQLAQPSSGLQGCICHFTSCLTFAQTPLALPARSGYCKLC